MEPKILGIILSILGITGLILALVYINTAVNPQHFNLLFAAGIVGTILFFVGLRIIPSADQYGEKQKAGITTMEPKSVSTGLNPVSTALNPVPTGFMNTSFQPN